MEKYDLLPYKIEQCEAINLLKIYKNIENKYKSRYLGTKSRENWLLMRTTGTKMKEDSLSGTLSPIPITYNSKIKRW